MNTQPGRARSLALPATIAVAALVVAADAGPATAQFGPQYGRPYPYGRDYPYGRPSSPYGREGKRDAGPSSPRTGGAGAPMLAIVALSEQHVTFYDGDGRKILQSPVSTGAKDYETPAGIFSVVQKKEDHHSNVYEDGHMPFMQRITWTGIALHAGVLPGQPASHGCVRLPHAFAQRLFSMTDIGMRVMVVRDDVAPADISHPALFKPAPVRREASLAPAAASGGAPRLNVSTTDGEPMVPGSAPHLQALKARAAALAAESESVAKRAAEAKQTAARKAAEVVPATKALRAAEAAHTKAEELLRTAEGTLETATGDGVGAAEQAKVKAAARVAETQAQLEAAKSQMEAKEDAAARSAAEAKAAEVARELAAEAAAEAARKTSPVSVFISRKTQRLYIRNAYQPVFEGPVTITDADKPIGSFVFTALNYPAKGGEVRWTAASMYRNPSDAPPAPQGKQRRGEQRAAEAPMSDVAAAKAALDRISIAPDVRERISEVVLPGSSLIISDEGASIETGKDTDFVVIMSGEPQGGLKKRQREPRYRDDDYFGGGGSFFPFFK